MQLQERIADLVRKDYVYAMALHHLGIRFFEHDQMTLHELCSMHALNHERVHHFFSGYRSLFQKSSLQEAKKLDTAGLLAYLRYSHRLFVRERLPFIADLIQSLPEQSSCSEMVSDLKVLFPLFVEEFILHIREEETALFSYIEKLLAALPAKTIPLELIQALQSCSISQYALAHDTHDDEMEGICQLTNGYQCPPSASLQLEVVLLALADFDCELRHHAMLENEVLFPRALRLEQQIRQRFWQEQLGLN